MKSQKRRERLGALWFNLKWGWKSTVLLLVGIAAAGKAALSVVLEAASAVDAATDLSAGPDTILRRFDEAVRAFPMERFKQLLEEHVSKERSALHLD